MSNILVYIDNCAYNRPFDDQSQMRIFLETQAKLFIQKLIINKELSLAYSYMSVYENNDNPYEERLLPILDFFNHASLFLNYDKSEQVEANAAIIMEYNIENKDAIHLACAKEAGCSYFITTDDDLIKHTLVKKSKFATLLILLNYWRNRMNNTTVIMNKGINLLLENLGVLETEVFISHLLREPFDYTKWRRDNLYADMSLHELNEKAAQYVKENPPQMNRK